MTIANANLIRSRKILIKTSIVQMLGVFVDLEIDQAKEIIKYADNLLEQTVIEHQILLNAEFSLWDEQENIRSVWKFIIDWAKYDMAVLSGDGEVSLNKKLIGDSSDGKEVSQIVLEDISITMQRMREIIDGMGRRAGWKRCTWTVGLRDDIEGKALGAATQLRKTFVNSSALDRTKRQEFNARAGKLRFGASPQILKELFSEITVDKNEIFIQIKNPEAERTKEHKLNVELSIDQYSWKIGEGVMNNEVWNSNFLNSQRRNAICSCGSDKKYKHCHGAVAS